MLGLPTETRADVEAIPALVKRIKHGFLKSSRARSAIGTITVGLSCFVPKPFTPFQWAAMAEVGALKERVKRVKSALGPVANLRVHSDLPRWAYVQALLARGDRRVADILQRVHSLSGNWPQALKSVAVNPDFYVVREREPDETPALGLHRPPRLQGRPPDRLPPRPRRARRGGLPPRFLPPLRGLRPGRRPRPARRITIEFSKLL